MSDLNQIHTALERLFLSDGQRVVFWNDPEKEFLSTVPYLNIEGVTVLRLDTLSALDVKLQIEHLPQDQKFLLYTPAEEPEFEDDWLLDIRLYSRSFRADRASILLQELGLAQQLLRSHLAQRRKFFDSRERLQKLKAMIDPDDSAHDLDRKMMTVIAKADQPELFCIVRCLLSAAGSDKEPADDEQLAANDFPVFAQLEKFELDAPFWQMVKAAFGYEESDPTLKNLLIRLMLTDFAHHLKCDVPVSLRGLLLPRTGWANAVVCMAQWRDSSSRGGSYDRLSVEVAAVLKIDDHLQAPDVEDLLDVMTFLSVEKRIAHCLRERVQATAATISAETIRAVARRRQSGHWASTAIGDSSDAPRQALHAVYDALVAAADFHSLKNQYPTGFDYPSATELYRAYETELYRFDQLYRHFCEAANTAEGQGWNIVKPLRDDIEAHYVNWYLTGLSLAWGRFMDCEQGLLTKWQIDQVPGQQRFFDHHVKPWLDEGENRRAFVIISDAFRYEAAQELTAELNGMYRFEATLSSQLGVLPSYTALGMASLLPHRKLSWKGADVLVDGQSSSAAGRDAILQSVGGLACRSEQLMAMKKDEGRELVRDRRVVYVYHDTVDAIGDDGKTEGRTFEAVRAAIRELASLVAYLVNNLNANHVLVTADHGFLYTETPRAETDKSRLNEKPDTVLVAKKRYVIGTKLHETDSAWLGQVSVTAGAEGDTQFWIPKGVNLFHFVGGAQFVHGGAMPQEIVVPVLTVKHRKDKGSRGDTKTKSVSVHVLGSSHRITTAQHRFQLIQTEAVSERVKPVTLRIAIYEGEEPVTDVQTVKFDSSSASLDDRKKWVSVVLKERPYSKKTVYRLVLGDAETGIEQQSVEVIIDRAFTDDF